MRPLVRFGIGLIIGLGIFFIVDSDISWNIRALAGWIGLSSVFLSLSWYLIFTRPVDKIKQRANQDDGSKIWVILLIIISSLANLTIILMVVVTKGHTDISQALFFLLIVLSLVLSWSMVHTIFTFHYAHMYYLNRNQHEDKNKKQLLFPDEHNQPDYQDFAYFSFVIGATFQVSDVECNSKEMRRMVLVHSLLSFALNTFVVALMINLIAGLAQK